LRRSQRRGSLLTLNFLTGKKKKKNEQLYYGEKAPPSPSSFKGE